MPNNDYLENTSYLALIALTIRKEYFTNAIKLSLKKGTSLKIKYGKLSTLVAIEKTEITDVNQAKQDFRKNLNYLVNEVAVKIPYLREKNLHEEIEIITSGYKFIFHIIQEPKEQKFIRLKIIPDG